MKIKTLTQQLKEPNLTASQRALLRCREAKRLHSSGAFDEARRALGTFWRGPGERPRLQGLERAAAAAVLLRVGALSSCGRSGKVQASPERAKDLLSEAVSLFEEEGDRAAADEARTELGTCYWLVGAHDEARVTFRDVLRRSADLPRELVALTLLRLASVERASQRLCEALRLHEESAPLFTLIEDDALKGKHHVEYGTTLQELGGEEGLAEYIDRALIEYAAAAYHFERAGHAVYCGGVENQLAMSHCILARLKPEHVARLQQAHEHLDRALRLGAHPGHVSETRARVYLTQGRVKEAERAAREALRSYRPEEASFRAEALTTRGEALAALGRHGEARGVLEQAGAEATAAGDTEGAGLAALVMIEGLGARLGGRYMAELFECAAAAFGATRNRAMLDRLLAAARAAAQALVVSEGAAAGASFEVPTFGDGFNFWGEVKRYEAHWLTLALRAAEGKPTAAARLLGVRHTALTKMLEARHKELQALREKPRTRQKSIHGPEQRGGRRALKR